MVHSSVSIEEDCTMTYRVNDHGCVNIVFDDSACEFDCLISLAALRKLVGLGSEAIAQIEASRSGEPLDGCANVEVNGV